MSSEEVGVLDSIAPIAGLGSLFDVPEIQNFNSSLTGDVLFLSAILYFTPSHWTVWINDKTYTADDTEDDGLKITKVTNHHIEFQLKDMAKRLTRLRANQSLVTVGHRIIDGDSRVKQKPVLL